ncbi:MAG: hypothetical protein ABI693_11945 [Bryobacteraceae bacterium]
MERISELRGVVEETVVGLAAVRATEENPKETADALDAMANNSDVTKMIEPELHLRTITIQKSSVIVPIVVFS